MCLSWLSLLPFRMEGTLQVRQTDQVWYHDDMDGSSLARAIHASTSPLHLFARAVSDLKNCTLIAILGALSSKTRGP